MSHVSVSRNKRWASMVVTGPKGLGKYPKVIGGILHKFGENTKCLLKPNLETIQRIGNDSAVRFQVECEVLRGDVVEHRVCIHDFESGSHNFVYVKRELDESMTPQLLQVRTTVDVTPENGYHLFNKVVKDLVQKMSLKHLYVEAIKHPQSTFNQRGRELTFYVLVNMEEVFPEQILEASPLLADCQLMTHDAQDFKTIVKVQQQLILQLEDMVRQGERRIAFSPSVGQTWADMVEEEELKWGKYSDQ